MFRTRGWILIQGWNVGRDVGNQRTLFKMDDDGHHLKLKGDLLSTIECYDYVSIRNVCCAVHEATDFFCAGTIAAPAFNIIACIAEVDLWTLWMPFLKVTKIC